VLGQVFGQVMVPPHPSGTLPQAMPVHAWAGVSGVQQADPMHTCGAAQVSGHCTVPPQPLGAVPQTTPSRGVAFGVQHVPASQTVPPERVPHWTVAPHASFTDPHVAPRS